VLRLSKRVTRAHASSSSAGERNSRLGDALTVLASASGPSCIRGGGQRKDRGVQLRGPKVAVLCDM